MELESSLPLLQGFPSCLMLISVTQKNSSTGLSACLSFNYRRFDAFQAILLWIENGWNCKKLQMHMEDPTPPTPCIRDPLLGFAIES